MIAKLPINRILVPKEYVGMKVSVTGGKGGTTDVDLALGRANAIKILANILHVSIKHSGVALYIFSFSGGNDDTSIPTSAEAIVAVPEDSKQDFFDILIQGSCAMQQQFEVSDPDVELVWEPAIVRGQVLSEESTLCLLAAIGAIPTGVLDRNPDDQLPTVTNNICSVRQERDAYLLNTVGRCSDPSDMQVLTDKLTQVFELCGATVSE